MTEPKVEIQILEKDWFISSQAVCTITPDNRNEKPVEVSRTISGKTKLVFEYNDGEMYAVDIESIFNVVDAVHKGRTALPTVHVKRTSQPIVKKQKPLSKEQIAKNLDEYYGVKRTKKAQIAKSAKPKLNLKGKKTSSILPKRKKR